MLPDPRKLAISEHQRWLGYLQPEGLVVSSLALVDSQVQLDTGGYAAVQARLIDSLSTDPSSGRQVITNFAFFAREFLGWKDELLAIFSVSAEVPDVLRVSTGEHGEILQPDAAYRFFHPTDPSKPWLLLVRQLETGASLDEIPDGKKEHGWVATPHQKFERLLRETKVPIGILCNGHSIRLTYAPKGENSGSITFPVAFMTEIAGRTVASALDLLLPHRRLITVPEGLRLPALLRKSRDYQASVSTALSGQVLESLYELARGFQAADEKAQGTLLAPVWQRDPQEIYGGLISTLLRLVFLLYAEDRSLMPSGELYQRNYSVQGLFEQLRTEHERYPDTMDDRYAGWPRLLALFRAVHGGCRHRSMTLPARRGHLFDPDRFPFLEGSRSVGVPPTCFPTGRNENDQPQQSHEASSIHDPQSSIHNLTSSSSIHDPQSTIHHLPRIADGTLFRVLELLLYLDGERLSYRTLDVEQIGSVYETIMGYEVQKATGRSVALKPKKSHGAPVHLDLDALLAAKPAEREKILLEDADTKLPDAASKALKSAATLDDLLAALDKRIDRRATPHPVSAGSIILQPNDERRRSGSHYTPRSFTEPIVRKTLEPILDRLGRHPRPEVILDLKICDIAIGSGAFQVEVCRQLADELVASWHYHKCLPVIPPDEDELLYARRLVAQRCLYGVDRNPMAVDLAKLSLWLATMAKDHPFTFVDHSIKCGDSPVGLTNKQIAAFHWDTTQAKDRVFGQEKLEQQIAKVAEQRKRILDWTEDTESAVLKKRDFLAAADSAAASLKTTGDLVIAAFFAGEKPKQRQQHRDEFLHRHLELQKGDAQQLPWEVNTLKDLRGGDHPVRAFHWETEFPEVFSRENSGFDAIVGNPPFAGKNTITKGSRSGYLDWLKAMHEDAHGNADLVAHFFRRAFKFLSAPGALGLIATNSIGQGDTRATGLRWIRASGGTIYEASRRVRWPGNAAVVISVVLISNGPVRSKTVLDGKIVDKIAAYLLSSGGDETPEPLSTNKDKSFIGHYICGPGFTFDDQDSSGLATPTSVYHGLYAKDPTIGDCAFPYIGGEEVLNDPRQHHRRYVIGFGQMKEVEAKKWSALYEIIENNVKPGRLGLPQTNSWNKTIAKYWWRWGAFRQELRKQSAGLDEILFHPNLSANLAFAFLSADTIVGAPHNVICFDSRSAFCVLQSQAHEAWARRESSSFKDDLRYTPTDCFETFPFPEDWETNAALEEARREYYEYRAALMVQNNDGLTKTYNRFHDPEERSQDILELRRLHAAMDRAVLDAYGWPDILTACEFLLDYEDEDENEKAADASTISNSRSTIRRRRKKPYRCRWPDEVRDEVLARLLALNASRAEEERLAGQAAAFSASAKKARVKKSGVSPLQGNLLPPPQADLFD
ncbi:MAG: class I SAM-dependent DNA methyltransferase [Verrucomicrobia bacterium]|nr:class I SAM-dependent DNA methyltransferase [Verrucomicrobiota bacterium]